MKYNDKDLPQELRTFRNAYIDSRWEQLHSLSSESSESAINYLFTTNAGGAVAILAYLGTVSIAETPANSAKISLVLFFVGLLFIGFYKAYMVHYCEKLFDHYRSIVSRYYGNAIDWEELSISDEQKTGESITPYIFGYISFTAFIAGCISGAFSFF